MVKFLLGFILIFSLLDAQDLEFSEGEDLIENKLTLKIKSFLDEATYRENSEFINVIFDPDKDRKGGNFRVTNSYVSVIDVLDDINIENNGLCDIWRTKYADQRSFTWRQRRSEIHCRLDV